MTEPSTNSYDASVIVVGAGPTGLMLANWLAKLDVDVLIVDQKSGPTRESRALGVQARTMEIYDQLGVVDEVLAGSQQGLALAPGFGRQVFGKVPFGVLGEGTTPYPRIYVFEQSRNEHLLYANLQRLGGSVTWDHRVTAVATEGPPESSTAVVTADGPGGSVILRARYCVAADGGSSVVRTGRGIAFEGQTNGGLFYVADAQRVRGLVSDAVNVRPAEQDFLLTFPMGPDEHHRLIGIAEEEDHQGLTNVEESVRDRLARVYGVEYESSRWFSTYRVHHRVASRFRDGPFFLAGDAAHVHSPVGAQGMNTGLQDAHNLALKLVDVLRGAAPDSFLDRYQAERRPVAQRLVRTTDRMFRTVTSPSRPAVAFRRLVMPLVASTALRLLPRARGGSRIFEYVSQTRIHYWMSPEARASGRRGEVVGRRLRWAGDNFEALKSVRWQVHHYADGEAATLDESVTLGLKQLGLDVTTFPAAPQTALRSAELYLVRPDGFVAAAAPPGTATDAFRAALPAGFFA